MPVECRHPESPTEPSPRHLDNLKRFFESIHRDGRRLVFEPRGPAWTDELVCDVVQELGLVHGVDPFERRPVGRGLRYSLRGQPEL